MVRGTRLARHAALMPPSMPPLLASRCSRSIMRWRIPLPPVAGGLKSLNEFSSETGATFPEKVTTPWELNVDSDVDSQSKMELDKILSIVDDDRMDILATLIRVTLIETELNLSEAILALRMWEHLARTQLATANSPGQLFSPLILPEEW